MNFNSKQEKFIFYILPVFLFSLIPLFLITGPFLSDLAISIISILFLLYCLIKKKFDFFRNRYFYIFLIFCLYLILNSLFNNPNLDSLKISFFFFRYGVFVVAILAFLEFNDRFKSFFCYCIFVCFIILILDGYYEYFNGENIFGWSNNQTTRISSFFGKESILGSYLSRLWPIFFALSLLLFKKKKFFFILILIFILSETLIFLSGERSAFFNINLSAIFVILFSKRLIKLRLFTLILSGLLILTITFFNPTAKERIFDKTLKQMNLVIDTEKKQEKGLYIFSREHTHHYITAYRMFLDNKFFGVGVKNFRKFCNDGDYMVSNLSCSTHPHNFYIQLLSETGFVGLSFLLIVLFYFCLLIFKHLFLKFKNKYYFSDFEICLLSGMAIYIWPFIPTSSVFNNWIIITLILNLPFFIWSRNRTIQEKMSIN